jgi:hypothetical protein
MTNQTFSTTVGGFRYTWDVERLWGLSSDLEPEFISIEELTDQLDSQCWGDNLLARITPNRIIKHARRILETEGDEIYPIILNQDGKVMDGMHRLCKAVLEDRSHVWVVRFDTDPKPDKKEWSEVRLVPC